jgi:hypothetical protein
MGSGIEATRELVIASPHVKWRPRVLVSTAEQLDGCEADAARIGVPHDSGLGVMLLIRFDTGDLVRGRCVDGIRPHNAIA